MKAITGIVEDILRSRGLSSLYVRTKISDENRQRYGAELLQSQGGNNPLRDVFKNHRAAPDESRIRPIASTVFASLGDTVWSATLLIVGEGNRRRQQANDLAAENLRRQQNARLNTPREENVGGDPAAYIQALRSNAIPGESCQITLANSRINIRAGQVVFNTRNDRLALVRAYTGGVVYQNLTDHKFYSLNSGALESELNLAPFTRGANIAAFAIDQFLELSEFALRCLGVIYQPLGRVFDVIDAVKKGRILMRREAELVSAVRNSISGYRQIERRYPGLMRQLMTAAIGNLVDNVDLFTFNVEMDFRGWLLAAIEKARNLLQLSHTMSRASLAVGALKEGLKAIASLLPLDISLDDAAALARITAALRGANLDDSEKWARDIARSRPEDREMLLHEIQIMAASYEVIKNVNEELAAD